ncbi:hypothetical protein JCM8097_001236 [Rhodosporidiobolus ruineniae]
MVVLPAAGGAAPTTKLYDSQLQFSAYVQVDGQPVPIYKIEYGANGKATCYIESQEGKEFTVGFTNEAYYDSTIATFLNVDGQESGGFTVQTTQQKAVFDGKRVSATTIRPFQFAKIALTDDSSIATTDELAVKNLGTLQVEIYRANVIGEEYAAESFKEAKQNVFDERSKKAQLSHQAGFGAEKVKVDSGRRTRMHYIDPYRSPWRVLEFKYRSRTLLELEDIVKPLAAAKPEPALPVASTSSSGNGSSNKRNVISLSPDDDRGSLKRPKKEKKEGGAVKVKAETQVIDLSNDSD